MDMTLREETRLRLIALARGDMNTIDKEIQQLGELRKSAKLPDDTLKYFDEKEQELREVSKEMRMVIKTLASR